MTIEQGNLVSVEDNYSVVRGYGSLHATDPKLQQCVKEWKEEYVELDPTAAEKLQDLYQSYLNYLNYATTVVKCSKPVFSKVLQILLRAEFDRKRIQIVTRSGQRYFGLKMKGGF